jgi:REP element-mobilizing transposase RayT
MKPKINSGGQECPPHISLNRKYEYRRKPPHYQPAGRRLFITFRKNNQDPFPPQARDAVLQHCLHDHGKRYELHAAVVMPEHVHLLLTPLRDEKGWPYGLPAILKSLKGTSARSVNRLLGSSGPVGKKNRSTTFQDRRKVSKQSWNTSDRTPSAEAWLRNPKTIRGSGSNRR